MKKLIKKWKKYNIERAEFEFVASGDSMGDTDLYFYDKDDKEVTVDADFSQDLESQIYNNVEFYEVSNGHYEGEAGTVYVRLEKIDENEEGFTFSKDAQSEYRENYTDNMTVQLTKEEVEYLEKYADSLEYDWQGFFINYSKDFYVTSEMKALEQSIGEKIKEAADNHSFDYNGPGEIAEYDEYDITGFEILEDNKIDLQTSYTAIEYVDSN